jgi:hypothetical protein
VTGWLPVALQHGASRLRGRHSPPPPARPQVVTAPYDPRFPATNQARHCFVRYNEYYK